MPILKRCPSDRSKYVGIGATILFTGILAAIASGYAMHFIFDGYVAPVIFGIIWGLMIFNLDRYIVLSMRKSNGKKEFFQAIPRFALAILIAVVISKPLELKIFEKEINAELSLLEQELIQERQNSIQSRYGTRLDSLENVLNELSQAVLTKEKTRDQLLDIARQEADGTGGSGKVNPGPIYRIKKQNADKADEELQQLRAKNDDISQTIRKEMADLNLERQQAFDEVKIASMHGISFQLTALDRLGDKYPPIYWANIFIIMLFIMLETAPILTKLISTAGPYDEVLEVHEHAFKNYKKEKIHKSDLRLDQLMVNEA